MGLLVLRLGILRVTEAGFRSPFLPLPVDHLDQLVSIRLEIDLICLLLVALLLVGQYFVQLAFTGPLSELFEATISLEYIEIILAVGEEDQLAVAVPREATGLRVGEEAPLAVVLRLLAGEVLRAVLIDARSPLSLRRDRLLRVGR